MKMFLQFYVLFVWAHSTRVSRGGPELELHIIVMLFVILRTRGGYFTLSFLKTVWPHLIGSFDFGFRDAAKQCML